MNFLTGTNGQLHCKSILIITLSAISLIASTPNIGFSDWTWVSGSNIINQPGVYGTKGVADPLNIPGARDASISWIDGGGSLWLFGGAGYDSIGSFDLLNDLWKFDGTSWTWISGSNIKDQWGVYGTKGVANPANIPGARHRIISWTDGGGNLWLFGGGGYDSTGGRSYLNDLWKFDGTSWTWVSGSSIINQAGVYGTKGEASSDNVPGARYRSISWTDGSGSLWLFGGRGYDSTNWMGRLNDLWKFDGTNWTWVSGSNTVNHAGVYGTKGEADPANVPGTRGLSVSWIDGSGNLWLFGGSGFDSTGSGGYLNDLWKFEGFPSCHPADTNCDNVISILDILGYIDQWAVGDVTILEVLEGIDLWAAGSYYWDPSDGKFKPGEP